MSQNCFQMKFAGKNLPKSDFKVILVAKNGAKLLPEEIFRQKSSKQWFQSDFDTDFQVILLAKNGAKLLPDGIFREKSSKKWFQSDFDSDNCFQRKISGKSPPKSDFKVILTVISKWF